MTKPATHYDASDQLVLTELEILRSGEERLQRLFPSLEIHPQFQKLFLQELAEVRERADQMTAKDRAWSTRAGVSTCVDVCTVTADPHAIRN